MDANMLAGLRLADAMRDSGNPSGMQLSRRHAQMHLQAKALDSALPCRGGPGVSPPDVYLSME